METVEKLKEVLKCIVKHIRPDGEFYSFNHNEVENMKKLLNTTTDEENATSENLMKQTTDFLQNLYLQNKETIVGLAKQYEQYKTDGILPQCMQEPWEGTQPPCSDFDCDCYEIGEGGCAICVYDCERIIEGEPCHKYKTKGRQNNEDSD